jgi:hypothetical protein
MKSEQRSGLFGGALAAGTALATILVAAALPAQAQGWKAETTQSIAKPSSGKPAKQQRKPQRAGAKKPAKSQERLATVPVDTPPPAYAPAEQHPEPVLENGGPAATAATGEARPAPATPAPATAAAQPPTAAPTAASPATKPVPPSSQSGPMPVGTTAADGDDPEPGRGFRSALASGRRRMARPSRTHRVALIR